jgi:hypothetical protein
MGLPMVDPRINPATGLPWELEDPNAAAPPVPLQTMGDGTDLGGGASAQTAPPVLPPPAAATTTAAAAPAAGLTVFPAKPTYEDKTTVKTRVKSADDLAAAANLATAEAATNKAQHTMGLIGAAEADAVSEGAGKVVDARAAQLQAEKDAEAERRRVSGEHQAADDKEIEEARKAKIAAGGAREHFYDGRTTARVFSAVLQGISVAAEGIAGRSGPTPVARILEEQQAAHEKNLVGQWEASKEAHELKAANRAKYETELDRRRIAAKNQALLSLDLIEDEVKASLAALGPDKAKAADALLTATTNEQRARAKQDRASLYDKSIDRDTVNRSETSSGTNPANRPLSTEAKDLANGADQYAIMAERQKAIVKANGGFPVTGPDATEFETNERKMATILQKPLGKSGPDAEAAKELQNTPNIVDKLASKFRGADVDKYLRSLDVNTKSIKNEAAGMLKLEGKPDAAAPAQAAQVAPKKALSDRADDEVRGAYRNALKASNAKAVTAFLAEMKRRGIKP